MYFLGESMNIVETNLQFPIIITQTICIRYICVLQRSSILFLERFIDQYNTSYDKKRTNTNKKPLVHCLL